MPQSKKDIAIAIKIKQYNKIGNERTRMLDNDMIDSAGDINAINKMTEELNNLTNDMQMIHNPNYRPSEDIFLKLNPSQHGKMFDNLRDQREEMVNGGWIESAGDQNDIKRITLDMKKYQYDNLEAYKNWQETMAQQEE